MGVNILPEFWDSKTKTILDIPKGRWPEGAQVRNSVLIKQSKFTTILLDMETKGLLHGLSACQIKDKLMEEVHPKENKDRKLCDVILEYIGCIENSRTAEIYKTTMNRIKTLMKRGGDVTLEQISVDWIKEFDTKLREAGARTENARSIHLRNLRAVQNYAVKEGYTENYPWRNYKIKREETEKRSLTVEELRALLNEPCSKTKAMYRDYFKLIFLLIGINHADLCDLKDTDLRDGRIYYERKKTHRKYNIKVEPEAMELIRKYKGKDWLIDIHDRYKNTHDQLKHFNPMLAGIIQRPPFDELTTYWARHTWATIAYNDLDISIDTISAALGHQYGSRVTAVYINPDQKRVDQANRRVIDWVFYGKR